MMYHDLPSVISGQSPISHLPCEGCLILCQLPASSLFLPPSDSSSSSSPDLICQLLIAVVLIGPHLPALDRCGPRDFICQLLIAVVLIGPHLPALDRSGPQLLARARCGPRQTSTGEILHAVGLAGPNKAI